MADLTEGYTVRAVGTGEGSMEVSILRTLEDGTLDLYDEEEGLVTQTDAGYATVSVGENGTFSLHGGRITGNKSKEASAGVHIDREWYHGYGERYGVFTMGGSAKIDGNNPGDLNFEPVENSGGDMWGVKPEKIKIDAQLSGDARITLYIQSNHPEGTNAAFVTEGLAAKGRLDNFSLSSESHTLVLGTNGEVAIVRKQEFPMSAFETPAMLTEIEEEAFAGLTIESVFISDNCLSIGPGAFRDCAKLKRVSLPKNCEIDDTAFDGVAKQIWLYIPRGGTTQEWAENYVLSHDCIIYLTDD